jgi:hypothetical protein
MSKREWKLGDRLMHAGRPEWGIGEVRGAERTVQEGVPSQRLTIRFERAGVKTLASAFADLRPADEMPRVPDVPSASDGDPDSDWLARAEAGSVDELMTRVPEGASDPFKTRRARLESTLKLYRFTGTGSSLLDWAAMQSGLKDPLTKFTRHELEVLFERFRLALDAHLKRLVLELRKQEPAVLAELAATAAPHEKQALKRADGVR